MPRSTSTTREPLDRSTIVAAGITLTDSVGVDRLTMRRLADELGFTVMALYNHVEGKAELCALMVDAVAAEVPPSPPDVAPLQAVRAHAIDTRAAFVRHPWAPVMWLQHLPGPARIDHMEDLLRSLQRSGLPPDLAHHGFHAVTNHVLGYTLQQNAMAFDATGAEGDATARDFADSMSAETHPLTIAHVHEHLSGYTASSFELVLDLILDGLSRLGTRR